MAPESAPEVARRFERQHPLAWIFESGRVLRSVVIPAVAFLVFSQGLTWGWLSLLLVLPAIAVGLMRHLTKGYALANGELIVREGVLDRKERRVRVSRIQNLDEVQGLLHRLIGAVEVKVETASGSEPEAVLHLSPDAAVRLREGVMARPGTGIDSAAARPGAPILTVPVSDLVRLGLIQNRGFIVVGAALGAIWQFADDFAPWDRLEEMTPMVLDLDWSQVESGVLRLVALGVAALLFAYLALSALSIGLAVVRFYGFTLSRRGEDLASRFGLLTRVQMTVPRRRVQRLRVDETLLHRLFRRLTVRLDTAGGGGDWEKTEASGSGRVFLAPVAPPDRLERLVAETLPDSDRSPLDRLPRRGEDTPDDVTAAWRAIDQRAVHRIFRRNSLLLLIAAFIGVWWTPWALLVLAALPLAWWSSLRYVQHRHYWATGDALWWRAGWPGRQLVVVPYEKIQAVSLRQSPFDRHRRMAQVVLDTAGSGMSHAVHIHYLSSEDARHLAEHLAREAGRREFAWG